MFRDRAHEALEVAAAPTLERIRRHRERAPHRLVPLLVYVEENLFDPDLTASRAWRQAGIRDHSLSNAFRGLTGRSLKEYITHARMEVAKGLVYDTDVELLQVSAVLGYMRHDTFADNFERAFGSKPGVARREGAAPAAGPADAPAPAPAPAPVIDVEPGVFMRARAEEVWQAIRHLAPEEQERHVRRYRFHTPALFDLLRERSRKEGRLDRRRGIQLAELALISLDNAEDTFGERICDLRALGWAWLGNAHRLALDFSAADAAFEKAGAEWGEPRDRQDPLVLARVSGLEAALRMAQRSYDLALELVDRARDLFRADEDREGEAWTLIRRATILGYAGRLEEAIFTLQTTECLLADQKQPNLAYIVAGNLANAYERLGDYHAALDHLTKAKELCGRVEAPLGWFELQTFEGFIRYGLGELGAAEQLCLQARSGFSMAGEEFWVALIDLKLALLYTDQGRWKEVLVFSSEAVPLLERLRLHDKTIAAVSLLARAVKTGHVAPDLLRNVQEYLDQDPLARLAPPARAGGAGPRPFRAPY